MSKPPSKPKTAKPAGATDPGADVAKPRRPKKEKQPTMLEVLLANPFAYGDKIKVWVRTDPPNIDTSSEFDVRLDAYLETSGFLETWRELLQASPDAPLGPKQVFLLFRAVDPRHPQVDLGVVSSTEPEIVFEGVTFTTYHPIPHYNGAEIGNPRPYQAAAKLIMKETGGKDWFGDIGQFASRYLQPPKSKKVIH